MMGNKLLIDEDELREVDAEVRQVHAMVEELAARLGYVLPKPKPKLEVVKDD
jgi:hypothetical protein